MDTDEHGKRAESRIPMAESRVKLRHAALPLTGHGETLEIRESRLNPEGRKPKAFSVRASDLGFLSGFGFRISDFED
jgi:hypothetical protein